MDVASASAEEVEYAIDKVVAELKEINSLYPNQQKVIETLLKKDSIIYTDATNSGKTLPAVIYAQVGLNF